MRRLPTWTGPLLAAAALLTSAAGTPAQETADPWSGTADLGFSMTAGNSRTTTVSVSGRGVHRAGRHTWRFEGQFRRSTADSTVTVNRGEAALSYRYGWGERTFYSATISASYNRPAGLEVRLSPGVRVGYRLVDTEELTVAMDGGGKVIRDRFVDGSRDEGLYLSAGQKLTYVIADGARLHQRLSVNPKTGDPQDLLYRGSARVVTEVTDDVGLEVSVEDEFESRPFVDPTTGESKSEHEFSFLTEMSLDL